MTLTRENAITEVKAAILNAKEYGKGKAFIHWEVMQSLLDLALREPPTPPEIAEMVRKLRIDQEWGGLQCRQNAGDAADLLARLSAAQDSLVETIAHLREAQLSEPDRLSAARATVLEETAQWFESQSRILGWERAGIAHAIRALKKEHK
jgi:hypothetical protein